MKNKLIFVKLDKEYCNYLRTFDNKVPYNFGNKESRPYIGILFKIDKFMYFAPLSSPKEKHLKLKSKLDLFKIDGGRLGVINFNNMLPVTEKNIDIIDINREGRTSSENKYLKLLNEQLYWLNRNNARLLKRSKKLYNDYINNKLPHNIVKRCCNFKLLESKCKEFNKEMVR